MQIKNKTMAIVITMILVTSMAISIGSITQPAKAAVINGVNYDQQTTDLINAGMTWAGMPYNISSYPNRLLLWTRFADHIPTWTFGIASPNPVGVGQTFNLIVMNPQVPPNALLGNNIRYQFHVVVTRPDGTNETLPLPTQTGGDVNSGQGGAQNGVFISDSTGSTYTAITPDQIGNYSITVYFHELQYLWYTNPGNSTGGDNNYYGTTFKASSQTITVNVQQEPVNINGLPIIQSMPTEYWTRPIEGQNDQWFTVSSNWLSGSHDRDNGGGENRYQADGIAPNSPHILWTRPTEDNGVVGGEIGRTDVGNVFNAGSQYQPRWTNQVIMYGRLYYSPNALGSGSSSYMDCVDLKTGELLWERNTGADQANTGGLGVSTTANMFQFGYYYSQDDPNQHGIQNPGWLFSSNYAIGYQPERGFPWLNITNVPVSQNNPYQNTFEANQPNGENLRFVMTNKGSNVYDLSQWNSSKVIPMLASGGNPTGNMIRANIPITPTRPTTTLPSGYTWYWSGSAWTNVTTASLTGLNNGVSTAFDRNTTMTATFSTSPTIRAVHANDYIWGTNGSWPTGTSGPSYYYPSEVTTWAISIQAATFGQLLYMKNLDIDDEATNQNIMFERATGAEERFVTIVVPSCKFQIYDMTNGNLVAETDAQSDFQAYGYFTWPSLISATQTKMAYGILFTGGYTGAVSAYSLTDGSLIWRNVYPSGGEKIPNFVQMIGLIADGKIYVGTHEHSADTPLYKGERIHALNATTGATIWDMSGWAYPMTFATADGVMVYWNNYDAQVYAIGKGPTQMTVTAPDLAATLGTSVTIKGTITDISAGTKQQEQAARFPNGVPAVSDAAQAQWMEYVYMQKGRPSNTTGVPITISVVDANGNFRDIGTTSSNDGFFSLNWKPDISGAYTVYASFTGSESYYPSNAVTAFSVDAAHPTEAPTATPTESTADLYFVPAIAGLFVAIIVVGLLIILVLRKRA
jgi:hypothetical protein